MRSQNEYILYRQVSTYLRYQYPRVLYHFDPTGLNLSKAQSGMFKAIQGNKWPDLFIAHKGIELRDELIRSFQGEFHGLFLELKKEGTRLYTKDGRPATPHIQEQLDCILKLRQRGYKAEFAVGFDQAKDIIDEYLSE